MLEHKKKKKTVERKVILNKSNKYLKKINKSSY